MAGKRLLKTLAVMALAASAAFVMCACGGGGTSEVKIDYGQSEIYSKEDMDDAIGVIKDEFDTWDGCELHTLTYAGDECNNAENVKWLNELAEANDIDVEFTECICFLSDFHSPKSSRKAGAFESDTEYTDWQWYLAREKGGKWHLLTWGYG